MSKKRDLVVNDLSRYEKTSDHLILEEHSHCEVPAGCGGAILRWFDPREAMAMTLRVWTRGEADVFFDGARVRSGRLDARAGAHVVAIAVGQEVDAPAHLALALCCSAETRRRSLVDPRLARLLESRIDVLSGAGAVIVGTSSCPEGDAWKLPGFDDGGWRLLEADRNIDVRSGGFYVEEILKTGARAVGLPGARGPFWIRCSFDISLGGPP